MAFRAWWTNVFRSPAAPLFAAAFVAYSYFYQAGGWNQNTRFSLTRAIVTEGRFEIDSFAKTTGDMAARNGHIYADKSPGLSFLAVPVFAVTHAVLGDSREALAIQAWLCTVVVLALPSAIAVVAMFWLLLALELTKRRALFFAAAWGFATLAFPYSTLLYGHQFCASIAVIIVSLVVRRKQAPSARFLFCIGLLFGLLLMVDYSMPLLSLPLACFVVHRCARFGGLAKTIAIPTVAALIPLSLLLTYHALLFGSPFTLPYAFSTMPHRHMGFFMGIGVPRYSYEVLFSGYRGLFYLAPWLLLSVPGAIVWWRSNRPIAVICIVVSTLIIWLNSSMADWFGGWAMGPRTLIPAIPFMVILASRSTELVSSAAQTFARPVVVALVAFSAAVMLAGTSVRPETPDFLKNPLVDEIAPNFFKNNLSISQQSIVDKGAPRNAPKQAWNLGNKIGLEGIASLLPLLAVLALCARTAQLRIKRHDEALV